MALILKRYTSIIFIFCMVFITACSEKPKSQPDLVTKEQTQCREKIIMKNLIDTKQWDEIYKIFKISEENQFKNSEILELAEMELEMISTMGQGLIGISLEESSLELKSIYAFPYRSYYQYMIELKEDGIRYKVSKGFNENSTLQYLAQGDSEFQDLCADSPKKYIDIAQLVLNRSAMVIFGHDLKESGAL